MPVFRLNADSPAPAPDTGPLRARRFRLAEGAAIAEFDLCERDDIVGLPDLEVALIAPGLRTRIVAPLPRTRLMRFAAALVDLQAGRAAVATLHATGASAVWLRVRTGAAGLRLSVHGRQFGDYTVRFALRDLALDDVAFRQLLVWSLDGNG